MTTFIFLRHGLSVTNNTRRFTGQADAPLHERGFRQAEDVKTYFIQHHSIDAVYSSDLSRTMDTVRPTAQALGLPIHTDTLLRELDVGVWANLSFAEVEQLYPKEFRYRLEHPEFARYGFGETYSDLTVRALQAIEKIANEHEGQTVLVCTHGGIIRTLSCAFAGLPIDKLFTFPMVSNASISIAEYENGKGSFSLIGYDDYLTDKTPYLGKRSAQPE